MEENVTPVEAEELSFWGQHRYLLLMVSSIALALGLVSISMALYSSTGAAQLDLSRPGYQAVAEQVETDNKEAFQDYSAYGDINEASIDEFEKLYNEQATKATEVDAFNGDPLSPDALEISAPKN